MGPATQVAPTVTTMEKETSRSESNDRFPARPAARVTLVVGRNGSGKSAALDAIWDDVTGAAGRAQRHHEGAAVYARDDRKIIPWDGAQEAVEEPPRAQRRGRRGQGGKLPPTRWGQVADAVARTWKETPPRTRSRGMLLLIDEIEAGLDVEEQRGILKRVRELETDTLGGARLRLMATTHSALVLGSAEPWFDPAHDRLCRMERDAETGKSRYVELTFVPRGQVGYWLTSEVLGLQSDRGSRRAEAAEQRALKAMRENTTDLEELDAIEAELSATMSDLDRSWVRWGAFYEDQTRARAQRLEAESAATEARGEVGNLDHLDIDSRRMCFEQGKPCIFESESEPNTIVTEWPNGTVDRHDLKSRTRTRRWPDGSSETMNDGTHFEFPHWPRPRAAE